jgi:predicted neuraminidase
VALPGAQYFSIIEMQSLTKTGNRNRNLLFAGLTLIAIAASGYKIMCREPGSAFVPPAIKALPSHGKNAHAGHPLRLEAQFVSSQPGQAVHAPSVVELKDGSLRAVWFSGSREGAGDVTIQTAVMNAATGQWGIETTLFDRQQLQRGLWRYVKKIGNPVIARAADGSLYLWMVNVSLGGWAGSAISWARSVDDGATWSAPRRLVTSPFLNISTLVKAAPVPMSDGSVGLPVYHEFITKFAEVLHINAQGRVTDKTRIPGSHSSLQPVVLVASPVQADAYMRAGQGGRVVMSATNDAGQTWAPARSVSLPNPDSAMAGLVASSGDKWLALNPTAAGRQSLALLKAASFGSFDTTKTLFVEGSAAASQAGNSLTIADHSALLGHELKAQGASDADIRAYVGSAARQLCGPSACVKEFSYPFLLQTRDGSIHLVYTWHRSRIKHVRIDHAALD